MTHIDAGMANARTHGMEEDEIGFLEVTPLPDPLVAVATSETELNRRSAWKFCAVLVEGPSGESRAVESPGGRPAVGVGDTQFQLCPMLDVQSFLVPITEYVSGSHISYR